MAGIMHKIEQTLNFGGRKGERRGQTQGVRKQGLVARIKHMIPGGRRTGGGGGGGGVGGMHATQGVRKQGLVARIKHMIPGGRRTGGVGGGGHY
ncbi:hypothetical protein OIU79_023818 [Salix purpurea]|uniref:Uncharacterized protein n=1 Tax=Salix purpurea TaxID=77065 RepID=A0A9Q1A9R5_SALPP|nr:hypothetical protein OIU79_023818 [Salix purpurea]